jgi:ABC-type nickel/cobalt efflux system permease component RcnA
MLLFFRETPKSLKKWFKLNTIAFLVSLGLSAFWTKPLYGHAADLAVAHIRVQPQKTQITLALPTSLVAFADENRDSRLSSSEIANNRLQLQDFFRDRLRLSDSQGQKETVTVEAAGKLLLSPTLLGNDTHSTVALTYTWSKPVVKLKIDYDLFDNLPNAHCLTTIFRNGQLDHYIFTSSQRTLEVELQKRGERLLASSSIVAIAVAFVWGAVHALSPGHGKTLVGAYLVGTRANAKHALFLGLTTTITHTIGVFALGLTVLLASRYFLPTAFLPWLSLISGLMVVALGLNLLRNRLSLKKKKAFHTHDHSHHSHKHSHHTHDHFLPGTDGNPVTWGSLLTLGIAGGLVPCPAALVLLLSTIALDRIGFGLLLVSVFSLGLAGTLTALGLLLVNTKSFFERLPLRIKTTKILSVVSALIVLLVGLGLTYQAVLQIHPIVASSNS